MNKTVEADTIEKTKYIQAENVHAVLKKNILVDGFELVLDLNNSYRNKIIDERERFLPSQSGCFLLHS